MEKSECETQIQEIEKDHTYIYIYTAHTMINHIIRVMILIDASECRSRKGETG